MLCRFPLSSRQSLTAGTLQADRPKRGTGRRAGKRPCAAAPFCLARAYAAGIKRLQIFAACAIIGACRSYEE